MEMVESGTHQHAFYLRGIVPVARQVAPRARYTDSCVVRGSRACVPTCSTAFFLSHFSEQGTHMSGNAVEWDEKQQEAIDACCDVRKRIVAVTGKAGTGKTLMMREVAQRLLDAGYTCRPVHQQARQPSAYVRALVYQQ